MAYSFDPIFATDPNNPTNVASNASIVISDPADPGNAPVTITDVTGSPLPNPVTVNKNGFGPAFQHATLDRLAWNGGGYSGYFTSYEGMKAEAVAARAAAETAGADAAAAASTDLATAVADAEAAQAAAATSATAAANSAALVNAPADTAIATAINGEGTQTKAALSATYASGAVHFIVSDTEPTQTEVNGKPVVWINTSAEPLIEVTPAAPTFADLSGTASDTYTIPTTTGVDYKVDGVTKDAGTYVGSGSVTVTASAQAGYTLIGTTSWSNTFSTATTDLYPTHAIYDTFTAADGTAVNGRTTDKGGLVWAVSAGETLGGGETAPTITTNSVTNTASAVQTWASRLTLTQSNVEVSVEYDISAGTGTAADRRAYLVVNAASSADTLSVQLRGDGSLLCYRGGIVAVTLAGTIAGHATSGTLTVSYNAGALTITTPTGTATATVTTDSGFTATGRKALFGARGNGSKIDNFRVKYL